VCVCVTTVQNDTECLLIQYRILTANLTNSMSDVIFTVHRR